MENTGKKVRAVGKVVYDEDMDTRTITVDSFTVIGNAEPEDEQNTDIDTGDETDFESDSEYEITE